MRYRVRRIAVAPLVRLGALSGALVGLLSGAPLAALAWFAVRSARATVEPWRTVRLPLPQPLSATANFVSLLGLDGVLAALRAWDAALPAVCLAILASVVLLGAAGGALVAAVAAGLFNAGGRSGSIVLDLEVAGEPEKD